MDVPGETKKLVITVDGESVYSGAPWHYDIYADGGATHVAVLTKPQE